MRRQRDRSRRDAWGDPGALACEDCQRQLGLAVDASAWPISFGVAKPDSSRSLHVRVRFYRATRSGNDGLPLASSAIDAIAALPAPSGETTLSLVMHADCVGVASDLTSMATCMRSGRSLAPAPMLTTTAPDDALYPALGSSVSRQSISIDGSGLDTAHYWGFRCALSRGGDAP